jgi:hypothetical protein
MDVDSGFQEDVRGAIRYKFVDLESVLKVTVDIEIIFLRAPAVELEVSVGEPATN